MNHLSIDASTTKPKKETHKEQTLIPSTIMKVAKTVAKTVSKVDSDNETEKKQKPKQVIAKKNIISPRQNEDDEDLFGGHKKERELERDKSEVSIENSSEQKPVFNNNSKPFGNKAAKPFGAGSKPNFATKGASSKPF